jgi:hypothetical protein
MKLSVLSLLVFGSFSLAFLKPAKANPVEYAVMSATPYNSEIALARERLEKFLYTANAKKRAILAQNPVVAVQASVVSASEVAPLMHRIDTGEYGNGHGGYPADQASRQVLFILLFDSRTGQLVSDDGVLVLNPPSRGKVGLFGGVTALYIGMGW